MSSSEREGSRNEVWYIGVVSRAMTLLIEITFHLLCQSVKGLVVSPARIKASEEEITLDYVVIAVGEKGGARWF